MFEDRVTLPYCTFTISLYSICHTTNLLNAKIIPLMKKFLTHDHCNDNYTAAKKFQFKNKRHEIFMKAIINNRS